VEISFQLPERSPSKFEVRLQYVRSPDDTLKIVENPPVVANHGEYLRRVIVVVWRLVHVETRGGAQGLAVVPHFEEIKSAYVEEDLSLRPLIFPEARL
jgi:hypothetical protein